MVFPSHGVLGLVLLKETEKARYGLLEGLSGVPKLDKEPSSLIIVAQLHSTHKKVQFLKVGPGRYWGHGWQGGRGGVSTEAEKSTHRGPCLFGSHGTTVNREVRSRACDARWLSIRDVGHTRVPHLSVILGAMWELLRYKTYPRNSLQKSDGRKDSLSSNSHEQ